MKAQKRAQQEFRETELGVCARESKFKRVTRTAHFATAHEDECIENSGRTEFWGWETGGSTPPLIQTFVMLGPGLPYHTGPKPLGLNSRRGRSEQWEKEGCGRRKRRKKNKDKNKMKKGVTT